MAATVLLLPATGQAAVTLGDGLQTAGSPADCGPTSICTVAMSAIPGATVAAPFDGVVVRWRTRDTAAGTSLTLRVLRPAAGGAYTGIGSSAPGAVTSTALTTFDTRLPIKAADIVGVDLPPDHKVGRRASIPGATLIGWIPALADGATLAPTNSNSNLILVNADIEPDVDADGFGDETQDRNPPSLAALTVKPRTFRVDPRGASAKRRKRAPKGTVFTYTIASAKTATVTYTLERKSSGRRVGGSCKKRTRANRRRPRCTRYTPAGGFSQAATAGQNTKPFSGKVGGRKLKPGSYRATLVAKDAPGNASPPQIVSFKVVK